MSVEAVVTAEEDGFCPGHGKDYLGLFYNKCCGGVEGKSAVRFGRRRCLFLRTVSVGRRR